MQAFVTNGLTERCEVQGLGGKGSISGGGAVIEDWNSSGHICEPQSCSAVGGFILKLDLVQGTRWRQRAAGFLEVALPSGIGVAVGMYVSPRFTVPRVIGSVAEQLWLRCVLCCIVRNHNIEKVLQCTVLHNCDLPWLPGQQLAGPLRLLDAGDDWFSP